MALFAVCLSGQAQKFLDIYKNDIVVNSVRVAEVDSMVVDVGTNNRLVYFFYEGKVFHYTQTTNIDSVKIYDVAKAPLMYLGIVGFNQELYEKPFGILDKNKVDDYKSFVNKLTIKSQKFT